MMAPPRPRATIEDTPEGLEIVIPAPRSLLRVIFLSVWLTGWAFGWVFALRQLLSGSHANGGGAFLAVWFAGWTAAGAFAIFIILWMLTGRERTRLGSDTLTLRREVFGIGWTREYPLTEVRNLRVAPPVIPYRGSSLVFWGLGGGMIAFDFGSATPRFAQVSEAEAQAIVRQMRARHAFPTDA